MRMANRTSRYFLAAFFALLLTLSAAAQKTPEWVSAWAVSPFAPWGANVVPSADMTDATLRETVQVTLGGEKIRLRFTNLYGTKPLRIANAHVALAADKDSSKIAPQTDRKVTFSGHDWAIIPVGASYYSDAIDMPMAAMSSLSVSFYYKDAPSVETYHHDTTSHVWLTHGDHAGDAELPKDAKAVDHWHQLAAVEVLAPQGSGAIVTFGDSITDGYGAKMNLSQRWPDTLAARVQADKRTRHLAVINQGIGGNHLLTDGIGPSALERFDRDVLAQPGVKYVILFEGVNDLGMISIDGSHPREIHEEYVARMEAAVEQIAARAHAHGIQVIGATITPWQGSGYYHPLPEHEADRQKFNAWIRAAKFVDGLIDFDKVLDDPAKPGYMKPELDNDHLHPNAAGYKTMGESVPLELFVNKEK